MEVTERVGKLEITVTRHEEKLDALQAYQEKQNGYLRRFEDKIDRLQTWLMTLLGGMVVSLVLLLLNLIARR